MSAFYNYSEPFTCECRAFGRLQETGHEELAVPCFGYLLLDEQHERTITDRFDLDFDGSGDFPGCVDMRSRFLGKDNKVLPLRGIVKAFGQTMERLRTRDMSRLLRDMKKIQQLGIIRLDIKEDQLVDGKPADFSTAITFPHFATTPDLNPNLTPDEISDMVYYTFQYSINDYWCFDGMIREWNHYVKNQKEELSVFAFPNGRGLQMQYDLRAKPSRNRIYSFVDPRLYNWRAGGADRRSRKRFDTRPPRWYFSCGPGRAAHLRKTMVYYPVAWQYKDGLFFPRKRP